ncbi:MAG: transporter substrate-binding domain-containing protein, partial [Gammaproteobacteria bacterium]|nr:transporter substrate-binding domain-containing protein [Gammaproteobacteria bacterium]
LLAKYNNNLTNINVLTPPLARKAMYIYLHKKHKELVTPLSKALLAMKNDGTYQKIFHQTLSGLEN